MLIAAKKRKLNSSRKSARSVKASVSPVAKLAAETEAFAAKEEIGRRVLIAGRQEREAIGLHFASAVKEARAVQASAQDGKMVKAVQVSARGAKMVMRRANGAASMASAHAAASGTDRSASHSERVGPSGLPLIL